VPDDTRGSLVEAIAAIIDHFEGAGIDYAIGGAVSYSAWAEPRATRDIDLNIWVTLERIEHAFDVLAAAGVRLDRAAARRDADERGMFVGYLGEYRVDVFIPSVPFYAEALRRRRRVRLAHRDTWVLSADTLIVFKMLFYRPKDLVDVQRLIEIQGDAVDRGFVRQSLIDMLGPDDERIRSWDDLMARVS
jgi:hypothetical protein